jgi:hypothetical protein
MLGVCLVVLLVVGFLVLRPHVGSGVVAPGNQRLSDRIALVPERDSSGSFVRLVTFDTSTHRLQPWAGAADRLHDGSTRATVDRFSATPSPDRTQVAYLEGAHDGLPVPYVADPDGTRARPLMTSPHRPCDTTKRPAWSPDGLRMAVVCIFSDRSWSLWLVDARDGAGIRELVARQYDVELGAPTWDAVGHTVYTWEASPPPPHSPPGTQGRPVSVADDADDSTPQPVSGVGDASYTEPDWSSPGLLTVHRARDRDNKVVVVVEGRRSVVAEGPFLNATWAPDGHRILATMGPDQAHLRLVLLPYPGDGSAPQDTGVVGNFGAPNWGTG